MSASKHYFFSLSHTKLSLSVLVHLWIPTYYDIRRIYLSLSLQFFFLSLSLSKNLPQGMFPRFGSA